MLDPLASTSESESAYADAVTESEERKPTVAELENLVHELHDMVQLLKHKCDLQEQVLSYRNLILDNFRELTKDLKSRIKIGNEHYRILKEEHEALKAKYERLDNLL